MSAEDEAVEEQLQAVKRVRQADYAYTRAENELHDAVADAIRSGVMHVKIAKMTGQHVGTILAWRILSLERRKEHAQQQEVLAEMTRLAQEDGLYDLPTPEGWARRHSYPPK
jgi:hypothetical protein